MNTEEFTRAAESQWKELVVHSLIVTEDKIDMIAAALAMSSKTSKENIKHKILAIRWAVNTQSSVQIIEAGQSKILSAYRKARRNGLNDPQRLLAWKVSKSLADAIQCEDPSPDQDEPIVNRIARLLKIDTSESLWEFWHSVFSDLSDDEILHLGGEVREKKQKTKRS